MNFLAPIRGLATYGWGFACPMMNDTTLRQIAAVKATANNGYHIWT